MGGQYVEPEIKTFDPAGTGEARSFLEGLIGTPTGDLPLLDVPDYTNTALFKAGESELLSTLGGQYDPLTSPFYSGFRKESQIEEEAAINRLNRGLQGRGMFASSGAVREVGDVRSRFSADRMSVLGSIFENERTRRLRTAPVAAQFSNLQTAPSRERATAKFSQQLLPFNRIAEIASSLFNPETYQTGGRYEPGFLEEYGLPAAQIASLLIPGIGPGVSAGIGGLKGLFGGNKSSNLLTGKLRLPGIPNYNY